MKVDPNFLERGYFETKNDQQVVRADLVAKYAKAYGELFAKRGKTQVSSNQLRAFYGDVKALERKIDQGGEGAFDRFYHMVQMLKARASYIQGKKTGGRVSREFRDFIHTCVEAIKTEDDFRAFLKFFESTVGFYYGAGGGN